MEETQTQPVTQNSEPLTHRTTDRPTDRPTDRRALLAGIGGLAAGALLAGKAHAGPLNPPPGPIAPTPGPEPRIPIGPDTTPGNGSATFLITQPGSYYLTGNIDVASGGISVLADLVTIDLNGFAIIGQPGSVYGIAVESPCRNATVRNGHFRGFDLHGVFFSLAPGGSGRCENITISQCRSTGLVSATPIELIECQSFDNMAGGFSIANNSVVHRCIARNNTAAGFTVGGIVAVTDCSSIENGWEGIQAGGACYIRNCIVRECGRDGIVTMGGSTVEACNVTLCTGHGIVIGGDGSARRNDCAANGRATASSGIFCAAQDTRIEENNCTNNGIGIRVQGVRNTIIRNTCSASLGVNYQFAAGNRYGPVIDLRTGGTPAVSGSTAADTTATTHPWANFAL